MQNSNNSAEETPKWVPKVIIFDLLTALLDSWSLWNSSCGSSENGHTWRARYLDLTFSCGSYKPYDDLVKQSARDVGLSPKVSENLLRDWDNLEPWPEVGSVLKRLKEKGYRLGVVTNCSTELGTRAAARAGNFDVVVTAEEAGFYKPHPKAYGAALKAMGVSPKEALFVAGSSGDVVGAAEAGMRVVWNNHVGLEAKPGSNPLREGKSLDEALANFL